MNSLGYRHSERTVASEGISRNNKTDLFQWGGSFAFARNDVKNETMKIATNISLTL